MKLAAYLEENDLKPTAFAAQIGTPPSTITRILRGERRPGLDMISKIVAATNGQVRFEDFTSDPLDTAARDSVEHTAPERLAS